MEKIKGSVGYKDLTTYKGIKETENTSVFLPLVYICSPYQGEVERNVLRARRYSQFAVGEGIIPITPHLLFPQFMKDENPTEGKLAMHFNYVLLGKCSQLWVFGDVISEGMAYEIGIAKKRSMKIRYFDISCREVLI